MVTIRDAHPAELPEVAALTIRVYAEYAAAMTPSAWAELEQAVRGALATAEPVERIVAERDGRLVGSVMLFPPASDAYGGLAAPPTFPELRVLAVDPTERGGGVGRRLVEECIRRARAHGHATLGLHTSETMRTARELYVRMGFRRAPEHDFRPDGAELVEGYLLEL
jgi:GNAT superfamily N-acetyltransferase